MNTTTIKTSELTDIALDRVVARIENPEWWDDRTTYSPSTNWAHGGPIIERENLAVTCCPQFWVAYSPNGTRHFAGRGPTFNWTYRVTGPTPLVAAMRCYVASKLGDTVEVPDELPYP